MPNGSLKNIVAEFDTILSDDKNLSTKTGLRLSMSVLRETLDIVVDLQTKTDNLDDRVGEIERDRETQKRKQEGKIDDEKWLRRTSLGAAITAIILLVVNGVIFLVSTVPLINRLIQAAQP